VFDRMLNVLNSVLTKTTIHHINKQPPSILWIRCQHCAMIINNTMIFIKQVMLKIGPLIHHVRSRGRVVSIANHQWSNWYQTPINNIIHCRTIDDDDKWSKIERYKWIDFIEQHWSINPATTQRATNLFQISNSSIAITKTVRNITHLLDIIVKYFSLTDDNAKKQLIDDMQERAMVEYRHQKMAIRNNNYDVCCFIFISLN